MVSLQPGVTGLRACSLSLASVRTEWQKYRTRVREGDDVLRAFFTLLGGGHVWEHRLSCEHEEVRGQLWSLALEHVLLGLLDKRFSH